MPYDSSAAIMLTPLQEYHLLCRGAQDRYGERPYKSKAKRKPEWCPVDQCYIDPEPLPETAEHHHIVLTRQGGTDKASNMAWMSCLNHILAHWLLFKATDRRDPHWGKVMNACRLMLNERSIEDLEALDIGALEKQAELRSLNSRSRKFICPATDASGHFIPGNEPTGWKQSAYSKENLAETARKRAAERYATPEYSKKQRELAAKRYATTEYSKKQRERDAKRRSLPFGREIDSKITMRSEAKKVGNQDRVDILDREIAELRAKQKAALAQQ